MDSDYLVHTKYWDRTSKANFVKFSALHHLKRENLTTLQDLFWIFVAFSEPRSGATSERTFAPPKALDSIWKINQQVRLISNTTSRKHPVFLMAESTPIMANLDKSKTLTGKRKRTLLQPKVLKPGQKFMNALKQMRDEDLTDGTEHKKRRVQIYEEHDLGRKQWSKIYRNHVNSFPLASLTESLATKRSAQSMESSDSSSVSATKAERKTKKLRQSLKVQKKHAHKAVTKLMGENPGLKAYSAVKEVIEGGKYGDNVPTPQAVYYHLKKGNTYGASPPRTGPDPKIPRTAERSLANKLKYLTNKGYHIPKEEAIAQMLIMIKDTPVESFFKDKHHGGTRQIRWFQRFMADPEWDLSHGTVLPAELARDQWTTAKNIGHHYDILEKWLEIAAIGAWFDEDDQQLDSKTSAAKYFKIIDPARLISFDETRCKGSMMDDHGKSLGQKKVKKQTVASKASFNATGVACNTASGEHLTPLFIWACGKTENLVDWIANAPTSSLMNEDTGKLFEARHDANKKGSMNNETTIPYIRDCILPHFPNISKERPLVIICDGHGSHLTWEFIQWCVDNNIMLLLRPPHTTQVTQGEDVHGFGIFKKAYTSAKIALFNERRAAIEDAKLRGESTRDLKKDLHSSDLMNLVRAPWQAAFSRSNILKAWEKIGICPWTRCVEEKLKKKEKLAAQSVKDREAMVNRMNQQINSSGLLSTSTPSSSSSSSSSSTSSSSSSSSSSTTTTTTAAVNDDSDDEDVGEMEEEDGSGGGVAVDGSTQPKKRNKQRSSALYWGLGALTSGEAFDKRRLFEEAEATKAQEAAAKRKIKADTSATKVSSLKSKGSIIVSNETLWSSLTTVELKEVLSVYEIYPNKKPPTPYAKGKTALLQQLMDAVNKHGGELPPGALTTVIAPLPPPAPPT